MRKHDAKRVGAILSVTMWAAACGGPVVCGDQPEDARALAFDNGDMEPFEDALGRATTSFSGRLMCTDSNTLMSFDLVLPEVTEMALSRPLAEDGADCPTYELTGEGTMDLVFNEVPSQDEFDVMVYPGDDDVMVVDVYARTTTLTTPDGVSHDFAFRYEVTDSDVTLVWTQPDNCQALGI